MEFTSQQIDEFWQQHQRFLKTSLVTETPHPLTYNLAELCQTDLAAAFKVFQQVELDAIHSLLKYAPQIRQLQQSITIALNAGNKIFLLGCGASGRLAMLLKRLWETYNPKQNKQIVCVAAAGDVSLIKSVEQFEDHGEFGVKQLITQGYTHNDLVIGLSASGESPFILAGVEHAKNTSQYKPYLVFNNPISSLLERNSQHILHKENGINVLSLEVGPMALTGSTRLQATTAMQIALGLALCSKNPDISTQIRQIYQVIEQTPLESLANITQSEADILAKNEYVLYKTDNSILGLSLLADITERSPTFNLTPFENIADIHLLNQNKLPILCPVPSCGEPKTSYNINVEPQYSPFYLCLANVNNVAEAWQSLLAQQPTCLNWQDFRETSEKYINGFDLSLMSNRAWGIYLSKVQHIESWQITSSHEHRLHSEAKNDEVGISRYFNIQLNNETCQIPLPQDLLQQTIVYKLCLNSHSTIMMGRLGYFEGNLMLSLKPSNFKLVDRAIRYSKFILSTKYNLDIDYKTIADIVFRQIPSLQANQSIVTNVVNNVLANSHLAN